MIKKITLLIFLLITPFIFIFAQNINIDSLNSALSRSSEDTNKVNVLNNLCFANRSSSPETAINYGEKALALAIKLNFSLGVANAYNNIGIVYNNQGEFQKAIRNYNIAMKNYKQIGNQKKVAMCLCNIGYVYQLEGKNKQALEKYLASISKAKQSNDMQRAAIALGNMGILYYDQGQYAKALASYFQSLQIRESINDKQGMSYALSNIGLIYDDLHNYDKALEFYFRSLKIREELKDEQGIATSYINIGMVYFTIKKYDKAMSYYERALELSESTNFKKGKAVSLNNIGDIYKKQDLFEKALGYYQKSQKIYEESGNKQGVGITFNSMGEVFKEQKKYSAALEYLNRSLDIAKEMDDKELMKNNFSLLSKVYAINGDFKNAYTSSDAYSNLRDSLYSNEDISKIANLQTNYETDRREKEIKLLIKDNENQDLKLKQKNTMIWSFSAMLALVIVLTIVVSNAYRNKRNANVLLEKQKKEIALEKKKSDELLLNILPIETAEELKSEGKASVKYHNMTTVMFTDFKGFTQITENISHQKLIQVLDNCFKKFDNIIEKYPIEKIKTIGDSYMCAGGLPTANHTHAADIVNAALEFKDYINEQNKERLMHNEFLWELRIGIHTGPVISGVVGEKKFAYDIWGDTVNTASRMESAGEVGKVNISSTTYQFIKDQFECSYRGKISTKGKGKIDMYFVENKKLYI